MENKTLVNYKGIDYELAFNLNVMEVIQEEYGTIEEWANRTDATTKEADIKAVIFGLTEMVNEGIEIYNEDHENDKDFVPRQHLTNKQVGRMVSNIGLAEITEKINEKVIESAKSDEKN
jgi:hypothetical protein